MPIQHTVVFRLRNTADPDAVFSAAADALPGIPGVVDFVVSRQVSDKSDFEWQFSMRFEDQAAYDAYDAHPGHRAFVESRWVAGVEAFQEFDFTPA